MCTPSSLSSIVSRHLGCFHVLALADSAPMNTGVPWVFSNYGFLQVYAQEIHMLDHMVALLLVIFLVRGICCFINI